MNPNINCSYIFEHPYPIIFNIEKGGKMEKKGFRNILIEKVEACERKIKSMNAKKI